MDGATLAGCTVGVTADRKRALQRRMLEARGAVVIEGPTLTTRYLARDFELRTATERVVSQPPAIVIADTGVGIETWFEAARAWGLAEDLQRAFRSAEVLARGPKAASAVRRHTGVAAALAPGARIDGFRGQLSGHVLVDRRVVVQRSGPDDEPFMAWLEERGAQVESISVYRWELPADRGPAQDLIRRVSCGGVDAVTFTSAPAVRNLFALAAEIDLEEALREAFGGPVIAACVGAVCAESATACGVAQLVFPPAGRLVDMAEVLAAEWAKRRP